MRVVLDAKVIVSAAITPLGSPAEIIRLWEQDQFELLVSAEILLELQQVLNYPKIKSKYHISEEQIERIITALTSAIIIEPEEKLGVIQDDEADNRYLECAIEGGADFIVTGDAHLLALEEYLGVVILPPAGFMELLRSGRP